MKFDKYIAAAELLEAEHVIIKKAEFKRFRREIQALVYKL
jgi:hypothetical protein